MKKHTQAQTNDMGTLCEDAQALIAATVDIRPAGSERKAGKMLTR